MGVRLCIIGCGAHANNTHLKAMAALAAEPGGPVLAGCCDVNPGAAGAFKDRGGFAAAYTDFREMIAAEKPDGVVIATPFTVTPAVAAAIARLGVPALIEKPPAETLEGCRPITQAVVESGAINMVAFNRRHMPLVMAVRDLCRARPPLHIDYSMYRVRRTEKNFHTTAIHGIDMVGWLAGSRYSRALFRYQDIPALGPGVSHIFMDAEFASGATARLSFIVASGRVHERLMISGEAHTVEAALPIWDGCDTPGYIRVFEGDKRVSDTPGETGPMFVTNGFYGQMKAFCAHAAAKSPSPDDIFSALQPVDIAERIARREQVYRDDDAGGAAPPAIAPGR